MNETIERMTSFIVMDVLERANELQCGGVEVIHLEVGEPDFDMPECVVKAEIEALNNGVTYYTHSLGDPELRTAISEFYKSEYGVTVDPDCIVVTSGSSPAILMTLMLLCQVGDEVILSNPGYSCYRNFALACHAEPVCVSLHAEKGFQYNVDEIRSKITDRTRAIFVNSPMNPTGTLVSDNVYKDLATLRNCLKINVNFIFDVVFSQIDA